MTPQGKNALAVLVILTLFSACSNGVSRKPVAPLPQTAVSQVSKQEAKDGVVLAAAERIDRNNAEAPPSPQQPLIAGDVEVIRAAVTAAPAADLRPLVSAYENLYKEVSEMRKENTKLREEAQAARESVWKQVQFWGTAILYGLGVVCAVLIIFRAKAAFATGLDVLGAVKSCAMLATLAASFFAAARFVSSDYFWYVIGAVIALGAAYLAYLVWSEQRAKAAVRALKPIVRVLDEAYESGAENVRRDLDENVFSKLSAEMKAIPGAKATVHQIRAEGVSNV